jgi:hypothetical protein
MDDIKVLPSAAKCLGLLVKGGDAHANDVMEEQGALGAVVEIVRHCLDSSVAFDAHLILILFQATLEFCKYPTNISFLIPNLHADHKERVHSVPFLIVAAMEKSEWDQKVCQRAMKLLSALTSYTAKLANLLKVGVIPNAMFHVMYTYADNLKIKSYGLISIARLAASDASAREILLEAPELTRTILVGLDNNPQDPKIVSESFWALGSLCRDRKTANLCANACLASLKIAIENHCMNSDDLVPEVAKQTMLFVRNLCVHVHINPTDMEPIPSDYVVEYDTVPSIKRVIHSCTAHPLIILTALYALQAIAFSSQALRTYMKDEKLGPVGLYPASEKGDIISLCTRLQETFAEDTNVVFHATALIDAVNRDDDIGNVVHVSLLPNMAPEVFVTEKEIEEKAAAQMSTAMRNLLTGGAVFKLHFDFIGTKVRQVYVSRELDYIIWKAVDKARKPNDCMKALRVRDVIPGRCCPALQRTTLMGAPVVPEAHDSFCFGIVGSDSNKEDMVLGVECESQTERDQWLYAFLALRNYTEHQHKLNKQKQYTHTYSRTASSLMELQF